MAVKSQNSAGEGAELPWSVNDLKELIDLLVGKEITEFEMEKGGLKIRIKRGNSHLVVPPVPVDGVSMNPGAIWPPVVAPAAHPLTAPPAPAEASGALGANLSQSFAESLRAVCEVYSELEHGTFLRGVRQPC